MATVNSSWDMLTFTHLLQKKMAQVGGKLKKQRGLSAQTLPEDRQKEMITARTVHLRFCGGKFQHETKELGQMMSLAHWLAATHAELNGTSAPESIGVEASDMVAGPGTTPPPGPASYEQAYWMLDQQLHS